MPSIIDQLTEIYVFIDDHLKQHPEKAQWRGSNNAEPAFSDAEVLTIGLSQSALGVQSLKEAYEKIRDNHQAAFPPRPCAADARGRGSLRQNEERLVLRFQTSCSPARRRASRQSHPDARQY